MAEDAITDSVSLATGANEVPALSLGETGFLGLAQLGGEIFEDCQHELRWPEAGETYKKMAKDGAIAPALEYVEAMIARVPWNVKIPEGYEDDKDMIAKANFMRQCMHDMDHSWHAFIKQVVSFNRYGFSVQEKVYRQRRKLNGSRYDDGLIAPKKLPTRSQDSITNWKWKNKGRELAGLYQSSLTSTNDSYSGWDFVSTNAEALTEKFIPRKKFLLFRNNPLKDSPTGVSQLNGAWQSWKYKKAYEESQAIAVAQDSNGFKVLYIPPQYMTTDASEENRAVFDEYKKILANMHQAKQSGLILPLITDENGNKMFEFEIKSVTGQLSYDTNVIIQRYNSEILTCLFADFLGLGSSGGGGSFSLAETKVSTIEMAIEAKLNEIKDQLNNDLFRQTFELNGWETDLMPFVDYGEVGKESLDEIGKFIQRVKAVGMLPRTPEVINWVLGQADIPYRVRKDISDEDLAQMMGDDTSNSGAGMAEGMPNGTGSSNGSSGDSSTSNTENT